MPRIGLSQLHYALLTTDQLTAPGVSYEDPVRMPGVIQANISTNASIETLFADDGPYDTAASLGQVQLELNTADLTLEQQAALLGHTLEVDGTMLKKADAVPPWVAIGFKALKSNGKNRWIWLLKGKFSEPDVNNQTKQDSVEFQTPSLTGNFVARENDGAWIKQTDEDATGYTNAGDTWFTAATINVVVA